MNIWKNRDWKPMLLNKLPKPFNNDNFLYEIKFDGIRAILFVSSKEIHIMSRNNEDLTKYFPELENIKKLVKENNPNWKPGDAFDTSILDQLDGTLGGIDFKA